MREIKSKYYQLLLSISRLVIEGHLKSEQTGQQSLMTFKDNQRKSRLYEKFLLEYFRKEYPAIKSNASHIQWQLDDGYDDLLPQMQSDLILTKGKKVLIIDAKYYSKMTQSYYDTSKNHSGNLYQIFTYVKNKEVELLDKDYEVAGMILYAKTDEETVPNNGYRMSGNQIYVQVLDLNCEFSEIEEQLARIAQLVE